MTQKAGEFPKIVSSFKIDGQLLEDAKEVAHQLRKSYSELVEELIRKECDKHPGWKGKKYKPKP